MTFLKLNWINTLYSCKNTDKFVQKLLYMNTFPKSVILFSIEQKSHKAVCPILHFNKNLFVRIMRIKNL